MFSVLIIILYSKTKMFFFHFCIFVYLDVSLKFGERRHTSFFSSRVFLDYYKFYFFLFSTLYLVSSFL